MAKQANRMMIGGFVVIAIGLLAASLVIFGSGKFFRKTNKYVLYFEESIKGLNVGAPVLFQGVQVGTVTGIMIMADFKKIKADIPVYIEIEPARFQVRGEKKGVRDPKIMAERLIAAGLRAMLQMQSFITGQLLIELNFYPDTPVVLRNLDKEVIEIPTIPSTSAKVAQALEKIDIGALQDKFTKVLDSVETLLNNPDLTASLRDLRETLQSTRQVMVKVAKQVDPLAKDMQRTVKDFGKIARDFDPRMKELTSSVEKTLTGLDKTMHAVRGVVSADAPVMVDLENTLKELAAMSRSLRELTSYLDQHPESLLRGKKKPKGN